MATSPTASGVKAKAVPAGPNKGSVTQEAKRPPAFTIRPLTKREHFLKMLIYGNYGVGKTYLAGTAVQVASMKDVLLINAEAGDLTLEDFVGIDEVTVQDFRTLARIYEFLKKHCIAREADDEEKLIAMQEHFFGEPVEGEPRRYRTVIIDSLSEVEQYCMNQLLGVQDTTRLDEDPLSAEFKEYKQNHTMILRMIRSFRNLPMHVIFTAAEDYTQDESRRMKFTPAMTGKLSKRIQGFMDMVGYYVVAKKTEDMKESPRRLYVAPSESGRYDAKHRYAKFKGSHFDNPSIGKILQEVGLLDREGALLNK